MNEGNPFIFQYEEIYPIAMIQVKDVLKADLAELNYVAPDLVKEFPNYSKQDLWIAFERCGYNVKNIGEYIKSGKSLEYLPFHIQENEYETLSPCRREALRSMFSNTNTFFYRNRPPGEEPMYGEWTEEEQAGFHDRMMLFEHFGIAKKNWGIFAVKTKRFGYTCSQYFKKQYDPQKFKDRPLPPFPHIPKSEILDWLKQEAFDYIKSCILNSASNKDAVIKSGPANKTRSFSQQNITEYDEESWEDEVVDAKDNDKKAKYENSSDEEWNEEDSETVKTSPQRRGPKKVIHYNDDEWNDTEEDSSFNTKTKKKVKSENKWDDEDKHYFEDSQNKVINYNDNAWEDGAKKFFDDTEAIDGQKETEVQNTAEIANYNEYSTEDEQANVSYETNTSEGTQIKSDYSSSVLSESSNETTPDVDKNAAHEEEQEDNSLLCFTNPIASRHTKHYSHKKKNMFAPFPSMECSINLALGAKDDVTGQPMKNPMVNKDGYVLDKKTWEKIITGEAYCPFDVMISSIDDLMELTNENFNKYKPYLINVAC